MVKFVEMGLSADEVDSHTPTSSNICRLKVYYNLKLEQWGKHLSPIIVTTSVFNTPLKTITGSLNMTALSISTSLVLSNFDIPLTRFNQSEDTR